MAKPKQEFVISSAGQPDCCCLPLWIGQDILLKIQAEQIKTPPRPTDSERQQLAVTDYKSEELACADFGSAL